MLDDKTIAEVADSAVKAIVRDLRDRRGLRHEWDQIDDDVRTEITNEWKRFVAQSMRSKIKP